MIQYLQTEVDCRAIRHLRDGDPAEVVLGVPPLCRNPGRGIPNPSSWQLVAFVCWNPFPLVPLQSSQYDAPAFLIRNTYVFVHAAANPEPPVRSRVLRIAHVRGGIKAPLCARLRTDRPPVTEERPDGLGTRSVAGVVLLSCVG
jgi:hypothetical protein